MMYRVPWSVCATFLIKILSSLPFPFPFPSLEVIRTKKRLRFWFERTSLGFVLLLHWSLDHCRIQLKLMGRSVSRSPSYTPRSNSYRHSRRSRRDTSPSPYHSNTRSRFSSFSHLFILLPPPQILLLPLSGFFTLLNNLFLHLLTGEGAVQVPSAAVEVVRRHTVVEEVALPHGDAADVEVGLPRYPLLPNRLVPVLVVHPPIGNIP